MSADPARLAGLMRTHEGFARGRTPGESITREARLVCFTRDREKDKKVALDAVQAVTTFCWENGLSSAKSGEPVFPEPSS